LEGLLGVCGDVAVVWFGDVDFGDVGFLGGGCGFDCFGLFG